MGSKGHCVQIWASILLFITGILAIIACAATWWTSGDGDQKVTFSLWSMKFEYGSDNEIEATHNDMCKNASGALSDYCAKINSARACTIVTAVFAVFQAIFLMCSYCNPKLWVNIVCLIMGWITNGNVVSAMILGIQLASDNSLISSPAAGMICLFIATAFALVGYVLNIVGACLGPKGGGGGCKGCCDCGEGGGSSQYGGHQRFRDRPPVSGGGGWRQPMGMRPPMRPPVPAVQPQMIPYQVPVPVPVSQQPPPQQINLNIRAVGPPGSGGMQAPPSNPPVPVVYNQHPPVSGNDDFGLDRRV